jgi:hypothetical protein
LVQPHDNPVARNSDLIQKMATGFKKDITSPQFIANSFCVQARDIAALILQISLVVLNRI